MLDLRQTFALHKFEDVPCKAAAERPVTDKKAECDVPRIGADALRGFIERVLEAAGLPKEAAQPVARLMVEADLRGSDTHGVIRLPLYVRRLQAGGINARPTIRTIRDMPAAALVDGDNAMGHLVMH